MQKKNWKLGQLSGPTDLVPRINIIHSRLPDESIGVNSRWKKCIEQNQYADQFLYLFIYSILSFQI